MNVLKDWPFEPFGEDGKVIYSLVQERNWMKGLYSIGEQEGVIVCEGTLSKRW